LCLAVALLAAACVDKKQVNCDPADESCSVSPQGNPCRTDVDCADGHCVGGTCQIPLTGPQPTACATMKCAAGQFCSNGACLPSSPQCKPPDPACIFVPHGAFEPPVHQWWWPWQTPAGPDDKTGHDAYRTDIEYPDYAEVMSTPVVARLHPKDTEPAVVFNTFSPHDQAFVVETQGVMRAIRGSDGSPIWTAPKDMPNNLQWSIDGNSSIAAGDCMGTGETCFITGGWDPKDENPVDHTKSHQHGGLIAFGSDGRFLWLNRTVQVWWGAPAIARLLGPTGPAQIVVGNGVYDGATGRTLCPQTLSPLDQISGNGDGAISAIADIDLDGIPEIVTGNQAYRLTADAASPTGYSCGSIWRHSVEMPRGLPCPGGAGSQCPDGFPAIANFAKYGSLMGLNPDDPHPQIVVASHGTLRIQDWTGGMLLSPVPLPADSTRYCPDANQGGAPTIADFDGDGLPEIGIAGQGAYVVWKPGKGFIWQSQTRDCSSNTGSSVFDFEGKGQSNVVYSDECFFRVYDGRSGNVLVQEVNSSCTAYEMPIVADIDGTGRARVLVPNNNVCDYPCPGWPASASPTGRQSSSRFVGLKALASPSDKWVNTRSVWNEHAYHVSNVNLDGTLPWPEPKSWAPDQFNTYRQNVQGQGVFSAPNLSACEVNVDLTHCRDGKAVASAAVYNGGAIPARPGVSVTFYAVLQNGQTALIGTGFTKTTLKPGDSEKVGVDWVQPPASESVTVKAVVDEKQLVGNCHPENNTTTSAPVKCAPLG
jgi:hypothetical protein